jgi:hypothetical protein
MTYKPKTTLNPEQQPSYIYPIEVVANRHPPPQQQPNRQNCQLLSNFC